MFSFLLFSVFSAPRIRFHFSFHTIVILDRLEYHVELFHMHMLHRGFHSVGLCANRDYSFAKPVCFHKRASRFRFR